MEVLSPAVKLNYGGDEMKTRTDKRSKIKADADKIVTVDTLSNLARRIAEYNIKTIGYYSFTEADTNIKVYVE